MEHKTYTMPVLSRQRRLDTIKACQNEVERLKTRIPECSSVLEAEPYSRLLDAQAIALAALTAEPVGEWVVQYYRYEDGSSREAFASMDKEPDAKAKLYTVPPVPALKLPRCRTFASEMSAVDDPVEVSAEVRGFNACLAEVKHLNGVA